jgi:hypothetical protein
MTHTVPSIAAPPSWHEHRAIPTAAASEQVCIDGVEHGVVARKLADEGSVAVHHAVHVGEANGVQVLARGHVSLDVVEVVVGDSGHEVVGGGSVAEHGLELALQGGDKVRDWLTYFSIGRDLVSRTMFNWDNSISSNSILFGS